MKSGTMGRIIGMVLSFSLVITALGFMAFLLDDVARRGGDFLLVGLAGEMLVFSFLMFGPIGKSIAKLLEGESGADMAQLNRMADLEDRLSEISGEVQRMGEIEARVEFAERLLAQPTGDYPKESR